MRVESVKGYEQRVVPLVPPRQAPSLSENSRAAQGGPHPASEDLKRWRPVSEKVEAVQEEDARERRVHLRLHEASGRLQIQVLDRLTGEVLDAIPPELILELVAELKRLAGQAFDRKA